MSPERATFENTQACSGLRQRRASAVAPFVGRRPQAGKERTHQGHSCSSRGPLPERHGVLRTRPRRKGLGERLIHIKDLIEDLPVSEPEYGYKEAGMRPGLGLFAVPEGCGGGAAPLGSSIQLNSQSKARSGISGISTHGRKFLRDSLVLMEDFKHLLCMWTVTLPTREYELFANGTASWPVFQRRVIDLVCRYLRENGVDALVVAAVEIGDQRARRTGRPMPHIHLVLNGWGCRRADGQWLLSPKVMDQLVTKACQYAGLPPTERPAMSSVEPIRKSVHNYVSKYLTKQAGVQEVDLSEGWDECIPRQWWNASEEARALVDRCFFKLSPGFVAFVVRKQVELERAELGRAFAIRVGERKSMTRGLVGIELTKFQFFSTETLVTALEWYCLWVVDSSVVISGGPPVVP